MSFIKNVPDDYYRLNIINVFNDVSLNNIDYDSNIHLRNPPITDKLTLNHIEFIEFFVRLVKPKNFLELGFQFGECCLRLIDLIPQNYYAVDIFKTDNVDYFLNNKKNFLFYNMSTDLFFDNLKSRDINLGLDMVLIDACHSHSASLKDFLNVKDHVNEDGFIFLHDTYPASSYWTDEGLCNDCYKTSEIIRKNFNNEFEIITIPINPGISIVRKCKKQLKWI
jgi:predicted O-methyltransferase YrrM